MEHYMARERRRQIEEQNNAARLQKRPEKLSRHRIASNADRLSRPKANPRYTDFDDAPKQRPIRSKSHNQAEFVNRLARPKLHNDEHEIESKLLHSRSVTGQQLQQSYERLSTPKKYPQGPSMQPQVSKKCTVDEQRAISERLASLRKRTEPKIASSRGPSKLAHEVEEIVERLATPRKTAEKKINRRVAIEKHDVTKKDLDALCERLADPKYARVRTPDARRLLDRQFNPVNTYAWHGINPQGVLSGEIVH